jgi:hypothetical protein
MAGRRWPGISRALARVRWPLAGLAALVIILACVLVIPQWLIRWELGAQARTLTPTDTAKAINDVRATLLQGIGGAVILLGAYFTYRQLQTGREQLQIAQQGQVTERFTRAIDQLGHAELDVRLGGIYALERIANDSPNDRTTIAEVLRTKRGCAGARRTGGDGCWLTTDLGGWGCESPAARMTTGHRLRLAGHLPW